MSFRLLLVGVLTAAALGASAQTLVNASTTTPTASPSASSSPSPSISSSSASPVITFPVYPPPQTLPPGSIRVLPTTVAQGGKVQVFMDRCFGFAYSDAFGKFWPPMPGDKPRYATVYRDAQIGPHEVVMLCADGDVGPPAILTVTAAQTTRTPAGGAGTGGGGAADQVWSQRP